MMETTKKQRDGFAALAAWRLRPLPRASDDLRPFPAAEIGNDEFLQAVCRDVDTLVAENARLRDDAAIAEKALSRFRHGRREDQRR